MIVPTFPEKESRLLPRITLGIAVLTLAGPLATDLLACTTYPSGVASTDRVLSFLPSSGVFHDRPQSSAGSATEGIVVYDSTTNTFQYCDGTYWRTFAKKSTTGETNGSPVAVSWGKAPTGNLNLTSDQLSPIRLNTADFASTEWKTIIPGSAHSCGIRLSDNRMFCWGGGSSGQLGNGGTATYSFPQALNPTGGWDATTWSSLSLGASFMCAIRLADNQIFCWGDNLYGQLGNGTSVNTSSSPTALAATGGWNTTAWKQVTNGSGHTCAIRLSDDKLFCWGTNGSGRLGNGTTSPATSPSALTSTNGWDTTAWKAVAAGYEHTCGIRLSDNRLFCWGRNSEGQLGNGNTTAQSSPTALTATGGWNTTAWKSVAAGMYHVCAIRLSDDRLFCWGNNLLGSIGNGNTTSPQLTPTSLASAGGWDTTAWKSITVGWWAACAIRLSDERLFCWGYNVSSQLGNGNTTDQSSPVSLVATDGWNTTAWKSVSLSIANGSTCAIRSSDNVAFCWGNNGGSQLGNGTAVTPQTSPGSLFFSGWYNVPWKTVALGENHACGIRQSDDRLFCWGTNTNGQLGTGNTTSQDLPTPLTATNGWNTTAWKSVTTGLNSTCAIRLSDNYLFCWGYNNYGQLGVGDTSVRSSPTALYATGGWNTTAWKEVSTGGSNTCAIRLSDDRIFCWGYGSNGALGTGNIGTSYFPVALTATGGWDTTAWKSVSVSTHVCAIRLSDNYLFCWGYNNNGQIGNGGTTNVSTPTALTSTGGWNTVAWKSAATGGNHTCAIRLSDDRLFCWGAGLTGQLGTGTETDQTAPSALSATDGWDSTAWDSLASGNSHTCGIRLSDKQLFCWGDNTYGQLGRGDTSQRNTPTALTTNNYWASTSWKSVSTGRYTTLATEGPTNYLLSINSPPGVGTNDLTVRFPSLYDSLRLGKPGWLGAAGWSLGSMTYNATSNHLQLAEANRWVKANTSSTGTACSSYPDATSTRVIEFKADGTNQTFISSRTARPSPRAGSLIYNSSLHKFQYCDGSNWQTVDRDPTLITYSTPGTYSYTVPQDITTLSIESWGGGAGGGNQAAQANGGGGGGYSKKTISVTPSETLTIIVGSGGATGVNGGDSSVKRGATILATATGGLTAGGASPTPGAGYYDIWYPGGAGAAAQGGGGSRAGSGGGGGGGSSSAGAAGGAGASATPGTGGAGGTPDGGAGGDGGAPAASGVNGFFPGGGGGGSGSSSSVSGTGGNGQIKILVP